MNEQNQVPDSDKLTPAQLAISLLLIGVVFFSTLVFIFRGWRVYQKQEQANWQKAQDDFFTQAMPLLERMQSDLASAKTSRVEAERLRLVMGGGAPGASVTYAFLPHPQVQGRIFRIEEDGRGNQAGQCLLEGVREFRLERAGGQIQILLGREPPSRHWSELVKVIAVLGQPGALIKIKPADTSPPEGAGRIFPDFFFR
jgi:hypothetical protein